jgi:hypothetical protein
LPVRYYLMVMGGWWVGGWWVQGVSGWGRNLDSKQAQPTATTCPWPCVSSCVLGSNGKLKVKAQHFAVVMSHAQASSHCI